MATWKKKINQGNDETITTVSSVMDQQGQFQPNNGDVRYWVRHNTYTYTHRLKYLIPHLTWLGLDAMVLPTFET